MDDLSLEALKKQKNKIGVVVFSFLTVLTVIEFVIALASANLAILLVLVALAKAALIIVYFMHVGRLFSGSEE